MIFIGIDPGKETGVAVFDSKAGRLTAVYTSSFWEVIESARELEVGSVTFVVEDGSLNRFTYARHTKHPLIRSRINRNVGMNNRESSLLIEGLERMNHAVVRVPPRTTRKLDSTTFKRYTTYSATTNQHGRDAAMLVFGRRP